MIESVSDLQVVRYPPDGDVDRWVREGPEGHVNYNGGPVEWIPGADPDSVGTDRDGSL